jgi:ferrous iron transport protein B
MLRGVGALASFAPLIAAVTGAVYLLRASGLMQASMQGVARGLARLGIPPETAYVLAAAAGCNVPAAAEAGREARPRVSLLASIPFIPCSARLILIAAFAHAFFQSFGAKIAAALTAYAAGVAAALLTLLVVSRLLGEREELIPPAYPGYLMVPGARELAGALNEALKAMARRLAGPLAVAAAALWAMEELGAGELLGGVVGSLVFSAIGVAEGEAASVLGPLRSTVSQRRR